MTKGELLLAVRAAATIRAAERENAMALAWTIAALGRKKRLPTLKKFLTPKRKLTPARVEQLRADFLEIEAAARAAEAEGTAGG